MAVDKRAGDVELRGQFIVSTIPFYGSNGSRRLVGSSCGNPRTSRGDGSSGGSNSPDDSDGQVHGTDRTAVHVR
jgi:hypothetical protein